MPPSAPAPSSGWEPPLPEELQAALPQYEITGVLGRGGMGAVYKGRQAVLDREVAIKVLPSDLAANGDPLRYAERFLQEARAMAKLSHPGIVAVYDFGETSTGLLYFVMEFVDGMDVQRYLAHHGGRLSQDVALAIAAHLLDALHYAHARGIVHRDIKPANVLIDREGRIKVADFGLAKSFGEGLGDTRLTMSNMAVGTPDYIAPEALDPDETPDHRADLYAVGVMLYKMLTGALPRGAFKLPSEMAEGIDPRLDDVVVRALASEPDERHASAVALRADLDGATSGAVPVFTKLRDGMAETEISSQAAAVPATSGVRAKRPVYSRPVGGRRRGARVGGGGRSRVLLLWGGGAGATLAAALVALAIALWDRGGGETESEAASEAAGTAKAVVDTSAAQGTAASEPAFVNSLGMGFLPVPGTEVLFCIHETRWSDYAAFAEENSEIDGTWREQTFYGVEVFERAAEHPVANVSWDDALAFCEWLSAREGRRYRLPTDRERSFAEGIAMSWEEFLANADRPSTAARTTRYPWGDDWPPPPGAGNFSDASLKRENENTTVIEGYDDGFPTTAPVMSFRPNWLGLHDLHGNVWEWTGNLLAGEKRARRGGSFGTWRTGPHSTGNRAWSDRSSRSMFSGFRVALETGTQPQLPAREPLVSAAARTLLNDALEPQDRHPDAWGSDLSSDGRLIAFTERASKAMVSVDRATGERREIQPGSSNPRWNGLHPGALANHAAEHEDDGGRTWWLWLCEEGHEPRRLTEGFFPSWSRDGETLYFRLPKDSALASIRPFESSSPQIELASVWSNYAEVSPDGTLAATAVSSSKWLVVREMRTGRELASLPLVDWDSFIPAWSPDSRHVAFGSHPDSGERQKGLWLLDIATGEVRQLFTGTVTRPRWSGDGEWFAADFNEQGEIRVYRFEDLDLSGARLPMATPSITPAPNELRPTDADQGTPAALAAVAPSPPPSAPDAPELPGETVTVPHDPDPDLIAALETIPGWVPALLRPLQVRDDSLAALAANYRRALEARLAGSSEHEEAFYRQEIEALQEGAEALAEERADPLEAVRRHFRLPPLPVGAPEELLSLRSTWESERSAVVENFRAGFDRSLAALEADRVRARELDQATLVDRFRLRVETDRATAALEEWHAGDRPAAVPSGPLPPGIPELAAPPFEGELARDPLLARLRSAYLAALEREVEAPHLRAGEAWSAFRDASGVEANEALAAWAASNEARYHAADRLLDFYLERLDEHASRLEARAATAAETEPARLLRKYRREAAGHRVTIEADFEDRIIGEYSLKVAITEGEARTKTGEFELPPLWSGRIPLRIREAPDNCYLTFTIEADGYIRRTFSTDIANGIVAKHEISHTFYRPRYAICRIILNRGGGRELSGEGVDERRVALSHLTRNSGLFWRIEQKADYGGSPGTDLWFEFWNLYSGCGFLPVTDGSAFDEILLAPESGYFHANHAGFVAKEGLILLFCEANREERRYGKVFVEEVTETVPEGVELIQERVFRWP